LGTQQIILEGDSKIVIQAIQSQVPNRCRYGQIIDDIFRVLRGFRSWTAEHVKREANGAVHTLAKNAVVSIELEKIWTEETPPS
jgi:ribonuclease HI